MSQFPLPEWSAQIDDAQFTDPALLQTRVNRFERTIRRRNILEYAAGALVFIVFGGFSTGAFYEGETLVGAASLVVLVGVGVVLWQLNARASLAPLRPEESCLDHLRRQYERQYRALRSVPTWYLGPIAVGLFAFDLAVTIRVSQDAGWSAAIEGILWPFALSFGLFAGIAFANFLAARSLKRQIDQIDALD